MEFGREASRAISRGKVQAEFALNTVEWASASDQFDSLVAAAADCIDDDREISRLAEELGLRREFNKGPIRPLPNLCGEFVHHLAVDPHAPGTVYAGMDDKRGVWRSNNFGAVWRKKSNGLTEHNVNHIAVSPHDARIFAATEGGVFASSDQGESWQMVSSGYEGKNVQFVLLSPHSESLWLAGTLVRSGGCFAGAGTVMTTQPSEKMHSGISDGRLHVSHDAGSNWYSANVENPNHAAISPSNPSVVYVASGDNGLFRTVDLFENIDQISGFPTGVTPLYVTICPFRDQLIAVGTRRDGLWLSQDEGISWKQVAASKDSQVTSVLFENTGKGTTILAASDRGLLAGSNRSGGWSLIKMNCYRWCMSLAALSNGSVLLGSSGGGVFYRAPGGRDWLQRNRGFRELHSIMDVTSPMPGKYFVASQFGLYRSCDDGGSWVKVGFDSEFATNVIAEALPAPYRTVSMSGLHLSTDRGSSVQHLAARQKAKVYIGTSLGSLLRSTDDGITWKCLLRSEFQPDTFITHRLPDNHVRDLFVTKQDPPRIYVLQGRNGIQRSDDGGEAWHRIGAGQIPSGLNTMQVLSLDGERLLVGYPGEGRTNKNSGGISWSSDAGRTWKVSLETSEPVTGFSVPPDSEEHVYAVTLGCAVYRSDDGGETFSNLRTADRGAANRWSSILAGPERETILIGYSQGGLYSTDAGNTWMSLNTKDFQYVNRLRLCRGAVYAATKEGAFEIRTDQL